MANYVKNVERKRTGMSRGTTLSDDGKRLGALPPEEYNKKLAAIDWSNHTTKTKMTVKGSPIHIDEDVVPAYRSVR